MSDREGGAEGGRKGKMSLVSSVPPPAITQIVRISQGSISAKTGDEDKHALSIIPSNECIHVPDAKIPICR